MEFWASVEGFQAAYASLVKTRKSVEPYLNDALAGSSLASLAAKLRYVPIVMPEPMRQRYPARSKLRKKERIYDCAPQLNYEIFVTGTFEEQLREYLRGIAMSAPHLSGLGASEQQIKDFEAILAGAVERILVEQPEQTRH